MITDSKRPGVAGSDLTLEILLSIYDSVLLPDHRQHARLHGLLQTPRLLVAQRANLCLRVHLRLLDDGPEFGELWRLPELELVHWMQWIALPPAEERVSGTLNGVRLFVTPP